MQHVESKDGTGIAYTGGGDGPAVVLVGGGLDDGSENATLIPSLGDSFSVASYARRGRGDSGDTPPHSLQRQQRHARACTAPGAVGAVRWWRRHW